ncbi:MAG TPA: phage portal protein [Actinomycetota bacterium]|nr:phage portal protein [Actinomycetota bacterium]
MVVAPDPPASPPPPRPVAQPWAGWPAEWDVPPWNGGGALTRLTDTAWTCIDLNASVLASMPPYLVGANPTVDAAWLENPDPDLYTSWDEFAKQLVWDYQLGEVFVLATARYATGYPARFHVVPGWTVNVEMDSGRRRYSIGSYDVTADLLHVRYQSTTADAHGHGPLEVGAGRLVASSVLARYAAGLASSGGVPTSILTHPEELRPAQAAELQQAWITARTANLGAPAVLSGGVEWKATQLNPRDMALVELASWNDARIAVLLGVPPFLAGLPSGGDSMTYSNVTSLFDYHWRAGLRPKAQAIMGALSGWLLPRGTLVEVNRDAYVRPGPLERAQTYQILNALVDQQGNPAITVQEIRDAERLDERLPAAVMRG